MASPVSVHQDQTRRAVLLPQAVCRPAQQAWVEAAQALQVFPDPYIGTNDGRIPDVFDSGPDLYTMLWHTAFRLPRSFSPAPSQQAWLELRGINYIVQATINRAQTRFSAPAGAFLRRRANITQHLLPNAAQATDLAVDGGHSNHLLLLIKPPDHVGCTGKGCVLSGKLRGCVRSPLCLHG